MRRFIICLMIIVFTSTNVHAVNVNTLTLETSSSSIHVNDNINVDIVLTELSQVYGLQVKIIFDTNYLVANTVDVKINENLSTKDHFVALNSVDNKNGVGKVALTLLGDEKALDSDFSIGSISFKCIKSGNTNIQIEHSRFLTKDGKIIEHDVKSLTLNIADKDKNSLESKRDENKLLSTQFPEVDALIDFKDTKSHWAKDYISELSSMGIINGVNAEEFKPDAFITRCELAKIINLSTDLENTDSINYADSFIDKNDIPRWAINHVDNLAHLGIICGYNDNTFKPNKEITRAELAVIVDRVLRGSSLCDTEHLFTDDSDISNWGKSSVYMIKQLGIINGYTDGSFRPNNPVTRAEVCKVVVMMLDVLKR